MHSPVHQRAIAVMWIYVVGLLAVLLVKGEHQIAVALFLVVIITAMLHYGWKKCGDAINVVCLLAGAGVCWWLWQC